MLLERRIQLLLKEHLSPSALWELLLSLVPGHLLSLVLPGGMDGSTEAALSVVL